MRLSFRCLLSVMALLANPGAEAITNGEVASDDEFRAETPWVVIVAGESASDQCSGVLISPRFVLTAGHCAGGAVAVLSGSPSRALAQRAAVREVITHPRFRREPLEYDLGLLRLARPVPASPVPIASRAEAWSLIRPHARATIMGWGNVASGGDRPDILRRARVVFTQVRIIGSNIVYRSEQGGPCSGDSGGPLILRGHDGVSVLVGIASNTDGDLCATGGGAAAYTDVSALIDFIRQNVPEFLERMPPLEFGGPG